MNILWLMIAFVSVSVTVLVVLGLFRRLSINYNWLDTPTSRGSHHHATPHIGGVVIMLALVVILGLLTLNDYLPLKPAIIWMLVIGVLGISGFIDDVRDLSWQIRIAVQLLVAIAAVWHFGGIDSLNIGFVTISLSGVSALIGILWVVGFVNMYNFMDGINGLAGLQALIAGLIFAVWLYNFELVGESLLFAGIAASACGFLYWNYSPARIFLGDSGSTLLGGVFAVAALQLHNQINLSILFPVLVFAWFLTDTIYTFLGRLLRGEKVWEAHRQHIYQKMAPTTADHTKAAGIISLLTLIIALCTTFVVIGRPVV